MATAADWGWRIARAPAKVNLSLRIVGRRDDGYHLLDSLIVFADFGDHVALRPTAAAPALALRGPFAKGLDGPAASNLAVQADAAFAAAFGGPRADIRLWKRLPAAAGIGGGSADAAAVLRLKAAAIGLALDDPDLQAVALGLGADVPMCLAGAPARAEGVGERLSPAPAMPPLPCLLVNPGLPVATPAVFKARTGSFSPPSALPERFQDVAAVADATSTIGNDLQAPAVTVAPAIADVLARLRETEGALAAAMSGSGATCFAIYKTIGAARQAVKRLARPGWWVVPTWLNHWHRGGDALQ